MASKRQSLLAGDALATSHSSTEMSQRRALPRQRANKGASVAGSSSHGASPWLPSMPALHLPSMDLGDSLDAEKVMPRPFLLLVAVMSNSRVLVFMALALIGLGTAAQLRQDDVSITECAHFEGLPNASRHFMWAIWVPAFLQITLCTSRLLNPVSLKTVLTEAMNAEPDFAKRLSGVLGTASARVRLSKRTWLRGSWENLQRLGFRWAWTVVLFPFLWLLGVIIVLGSDWFTHGPWIGTPKSGHRMWTHCPT